MIQAIVFLPLLAFLIAGLGNRAIGNTAAKLVTTGALFVSAALSWVVFIGLMGGAPAQDVQVLEWFASGDLAVNWSLKEDMLTGVMLVVITSVSALVHLYSWGYMAEDPDQPRFFAYLSLFTFAMLMLVTGDNLVQIFFGWEGVGLASYLLIGFWYNKPSATAAAIKAFVVNRVGDFGFMLGIFALFMLTGTVELDAILKALPGMAGTTFEFLGAQADALTCVALLLFVGACGKSAQFLLHTWLPDAMEGPTPVSALIHAATMVTAGVFLVCRMSPLFEAAPVAATVVTYVGAMTAIFAATVGTVQTDIKRVIAYSTCSQLGYMFFAAGVGAYGAAMFHLFTHAFFKALLFLGAGSVIHAMHHEQDMRFYGGLRKSIPFTFAAMVIGTVALTGLNFTSGYYSKDAILFAAFINGSEHAMVAFWVGLGAALLTSFYSWRLIFLTFFGTPRWAGSEHIAHAVHHDGHHHAHGDAQGDPTAGYHPHESPWTMMVPLALLSVGALFAGFLFHDAFTGSVNAFWNGAIVHSAAFYERLEAVPGWVHWAPFVVMATGFLIAFRNYILDPAAPARFVAHWRVLHDFLVHKWYFDELYDWLFVRPAKAIGRFFWQRGDVGVIDRFGPDGVSAVVAAGSGVARRFQTGYLYSYALVMLLGVAAAATFFMVRG
ncbi:NADH-quinone oxidoreductase subunit L [Sandaracinobacteroides saxicola]|uniref:NADH-quinone oxidoreductase subunit L n=1 Tax=Sandaracinobacteroides saxicola TaxID=2759707 RepID=A0A7G5IEP8_9SPHN|nr:NADH-quinone oxidoreductase subunit L [Sandaracinobacteroides saxicola]QMW21840.1 NADH-quinone oxidoreductase subunit L [Sandaracinobacteroides saxicola]